MRHKPDGDYSYIAHYMDHWSKFHVIWPLKRKTADEVASGLNQRVFPYLGLPRIIHSDNGREFVNRVIREVVKDWGGEDVMFVNGRPRHSQSQGLVEQGNATIERHIANKRATLELADDYPWASWLPKIQYNMNTEVAGGTKKTPYEVVFGQPPRTNIIPDAKAAEGIINKENLPFELNPDSKDNEAQTETHQRIEDDDTEQSNETLPPVSRPTPKPRKRPVPIPMLRPDARTLFPPEDSSTTEVTEQLLIAQANPSDSCDQDNSSKMVDEGTEQLLIAQADPSDSCDQDNTSKMVDEDITDSTAKHFKVREEADANYRANAERMKLKYSKRKRVTQETFNEGDLVTIRVPKIDRSSTDQPRLVTKVASTRGKDGNVWYKLKCKFGLLQGWYRTGELMPYGEICNIAFDNEALISLREAARKESK